MCLAQCVSVCLCVCVCDADDTRPLNALQASHPNIRAVQATVQSVDEAAHTVHTTGGGWGVSGDTVQSSATDGVRVTCADGRSFKYTKLCVCTGARPKLIAHHPLVLGVRDTEVRQACRTLLALLHVTRVAARGYGSRWSVFATSLLLRAGS